jgi:hypothetical protein
MLFLDYVVKGYKVQFHATLFAILCKLSEYLPVHPDFALHERQPSA